MNIKECKCPASLDNGLLHLEDGTCIDMDLLYETLLALCKYAENATPESDFVPDCVAIAYGLIDQMESIT